MTEYRRIYILGAACFFTVNLAERKGNRRLICLGLGTLQISPLCRTWLVSGKLGMPKYRPMPCGGGNDAIDAVLYPSPHPTALKSSI